MSARRGNMRQRIVLEQNSPTKDALGGEIPNWQSITPAPIWARVRPLRGRELVRAGARTAEFSHEITVDYRAAILDVPRDRLRVLWGNKTLNVVSAQNTDEEHYQIEILAVEGMAT